MDRSSEEKALNQAAREGDTSILEALIQVNQTLLQTVMPPFTETALHIAAFAGKVEFTRRLLELEPSLAKQTIRQGINPLHIASARGHDDVVSALLISNPELVFIKDIEGATPLHYAAYYGRANVIGRLFSHVPDKRELLMQVNSKRETALHVAIKSKQLGVIRVLDETLENMRDPEFSEQVLRQAKDQFGHSVLQLIIDSDLQTEFSAQMNGQAPEMILASIPNFQQSPFDEPRANHRTNSEVGTVTHQLLRKSIAREAMLVTGILIATVTFQALMNPPQSILKNLEANNQKINNLYIFFIVCNSVSFFVSCVGILSATKTDISMLNFFVSSGLTWAAACYIGVLISMMNKRRFPKIISILLISLITNVVVSLFLHTERGRKVLRQLKGLASW